MLKHARYIYNIGRQFHSRQLVFVDESAADHQTTYRGYAWAICGQRAVRKAFFVRGRRYVLRPLKYISTSNHVTCRYSILPALSLDGILTVDIVAGSYDKVRFARFIDGLLDQMNPWPLPNSVIVMDNCPIHKCKEILDMITERCVSFPLKISSLQHFLFTAA